MDCNQESIVLFSFSFWMDFLLIWSEFAMNSNWFQLIVAHSPLRFSFRVRGEGLVQVRPGQRSQHQLERQQRCLEWSVAFTQECPVVNKSLLIVLKKSLSFYRKVALDRPIRKRPQSFYRKVPEIVLQQSAPRSFYKSLYNYGALEIFVQQKGLEAC